MPCFVGISLRTIADVGRSCDYLGNPAHPNHCGYEVERPRVHGELSLEQFLERLDFSLGFLDQERSPSNQMRVAAIWWVGAFEAGSYPLEAERNSYEKVIISSLGCGAWYVVSWHLHVNGAADINIIDPGIDSEPIPTLRRSPRINLLARTRARSDEWSLETNLRRAVEGTTAIPTPMDCQAKWRSGGHVLSIEELLAQSFTGSRLDNKTLPAALKSIGLGREEWEVSLDSRLLHLARIPGRPKTKRSVFVRVNIRALFAAVNQRLMLREVVSELREVNIGTGEEVVQLLGTTIDVIQEVVADEKLEEPVGKMKEANIETKREVIQVLGTAIDVIREGVPDTTGVPKLTLYDHQF